MKPFIAFAIVCISFWSCGPSGEKKNNDDTATSGSITIAADESLKPIIEAQEEVFESIYPNAHLNIVYTNEYDAMQMLSNDSARIAIVTRELNATEKAPLDRINIRPRYTTIAYDAIAVVVHPQNKDTLFTLEQLTQMLNGSATDWKQVFPGHPQAPIQVVFDHGRSGAVRMLRDSLLQGNELGKNCFAVASNPDVIRYVNENPNALGLIGVAWISDSDDSASVSFTQKVRVASLVPKNPEEAESSSMKPYQAYIALKQYPLWRPVFIASREARVGLGTGFASFVASDRGQRIILKSGLVPALAPVRIVQINNNPL